MLSFRQKKGKRSARVADPAVALADAAELASSGRCLDAVAALTSANRARPDPAIERRLVELRNQAFAELDASGGRGSWPPAAPDLFPGTDRLPEITRRELSADNVRSGIVRHGGLSSGA